MHLDKTISLNMIVKNESHIILKTLTNIISKMKIDYWVIGDNGSTDNTKQIITDFFYEHKIKGELYDDEWVNFGHNRTKALERAYNKTDFIFIFDADDEICGDFILPIDFLSADGYNLNFKSGSNSKYKRMCLVNNRIKWKYVGVLHECIEYGGTEPIITYNMLGDYYIQSNRLGARSKDPHKYLKDAQMLETAYYKAVEENDDMQNRYAFYCANSYRDADNVERAIEWYKKTLESDGWIQERYVSCLNLYELYNKQKDGPVGLYYLVKAYKYDKNRVEAIYELVKYYCIEKMNDVAYMYYTLIQDYYENKSLSDALTDKLFIRPNDYFFYFPYYMIIICERLKKYTNGIRMYEIIFEKKMEGVSQWWIDNLIHNLQFFIDKVDISTNPLFFTKCESYLNWLIENKYTIDNEMIKRFIGYGLNIDNLNEVLTKTETKSDSEMSTRDLAENVDDSQRSSNKILIYVGFSGEPWNLTYSKNNALGGSERAVIYLSQSLPKGFDIYICGAVTEETVDNIHFVNLSNIKKLIKTTYFQTIIVSRYIAFFEMFSDFKTNNTFIWAHDTEFMSSGSKNSSEQILNKWNKRIDKCVCLTEWHKNEFVKKYPILLEKFVIINNGICLELFPEIRPEYKKVKNRFIYSSRPERGLTRLLELWPEICKQMPGAELKIAMYTDFPSNTNEQTQHQIITKDSSIEYMGKLEPAELYNLMASSEYWLYPNCFDETSCISAMEMLYSNVICLYYPNAGLVDTIGEYGIKVKPGNEIKSILDLTENSKQTIRENGRKYAKSCSWDNRAKKWEYLMLNGYNAVTPAEESKQNTALIIEPRDLDKLPTIINEYFNVLGPKWKIVFYCGAGLKQKWASQLDKSVEIREMSVKNLLPNEYNDLLKNKLLWESLYGDFVLTFQADTWILNQSPYTIDYFMNLNKSYIGGNMKLTFHELNRERIYPKYMNFNGGLSLRKRADMIKIIDAFGSEKTIEPSRDSTKIQTDAEDVYFTLGCYHLGFPIGDDENCGHFALMAFFHEKCFGIHRPLYARDKFLETYPDLINKCYI